jgi:hypothetical protein
MVNDIIYQISVFGDFTSIQPSPDIIKSMINKLSKYEMLPAVFQEGSIMLSFNPELSKTETTNRLQMVSPTKSINIMFASNRIDINRTPIDISVGVSYADLTELFDILTIAVSGLSFTRIGYNTTSLLNNPPVPISKKLQPRLTHYDVLDELTLSVNKRTDITFGDHSCEKSNIILIAQKTMGQLLINNQPIAVDNGLIIQFDINTTPDVTEPRFFAEQTKAYVISAEQIRKNILDDLIFIKE